jgi:hypothetical protein
MRVIVGCEDAQVNRSFVGSPVKSFATKATHFDETKAEFVL